MRLFSALALLFTFFQISISMRLTSKETEWLDFKIKYNKIYSTQAEEYIRKYIFFKNLNYIESSKHKNGLYTLGINEYADHFTSDLNDMITGQKIIVNSVTLPALSWNASTYLNLTNIQTPKSVDWRTVNLVSRIKNQQYCRSSYAFAAVGAIEAQYSKRKHALIEFSPQNIVDCSTRTVNHGCYGGRIDKAFDYVKINYGINTEEVYPFVGKKGECQYTKQKPTVKLVGYTLIPKGNEEILKQAVATQGPIAASIDASLPSFHFYSRGIYKETECSSEYLNHAVLIVGYGEDEDGFKYWLVKNSWGTSWGEYGYFKLARESDNHCGIASYALYPLLQD